MGHDSDNTFTDAMLYINGESIWRWNEIREVTFNPVESPDSENRILRLSDLGMEFTGTITFPHCKTRKRFIKLLMSYGIERNHANRIADANASSKKSYSRIWFEHMIGLIE